MAVETGMEYTVQVTVDEGNVASAVGSGTLPVYATPALIAQMENAAAQCMAAALPAGQTSVGGHVNVRHTAATPVGMQVTVSARVTAVDGRRVEFELAAQDAAGAVGSGTHTRFIVQAAQFMEKAEARRAAQGRHE